MLPSKILQLGQWKEGSRPPFHLKIGHIKKAVGCLRVIIITFFSFLITCCISCTGVAMMMNNKNGGAAIGVGLLIFIIVFWSLSRLTRWRYQKAYGKTAVLHESHLQWDEGDNKTTGSIKYDQVTSISIKKARTEQLGYEFELRDRTVYDLDPDLAMFPATNYPIENSVLPVVLDFWDHETVVRSGHFLITTDSSAKSLRRGAYFWFACSVPLVFIPSYWGLLTDFFSRGLKLYEQAKYCGDPFFIGVDGVFFQHSTDARIPLEDLNVTKHDDVAIVFESRRSGEVFKAPITAKRAYTAGHWLKRYLKSSVIQKGNGQNPSDGQAQDRGLSDLQSDLF